MNRNYRRALTRLPTLINDWEVGLVDVPVTIDGVDTDGMLVVAEQRTGFARGAGPVVRGETLWPVLHQAFHDPGPPATPGRPRRILCADPALQRRLARLLKGSGIQVSLVESVPEVDRVVDSMSQHFSGPTAPGITTDFALWAEALEQLAQAAPWRFVSDAVTFHFSAPGDLGQVVAVLMGQAGEQRGVAVYPSPEHHEKFLAAAELRDLDALLESESLCLYLDPVDEFEPREAQESRELGLPTTDGLYPRLLVLAGGQPMSASEAAQRTCLAVIQGMLALVEHAGDSLEVAPAQCTAVTVLGPLTVHSRPMPDEAVSPDLIEVDHLWGTNRLVRDGEEARTAVVVKLAKRDAERLALRLMEVDALQIREDRWGFALYAMAGDAVLGPLVRGPEPRELEELRMETQVILCVSAGGSKRPQLRPRDFIMTRVVRFHADIRPSLVVQDPVFDGPVGAWPKASKTLLDFVKPVTVGASAQDLRRSVDLAATVWNATVLADYSGRPKFLLDMRKALGGASEPGLVFEALISRKRSKFAGDPRLFTVTDFKVERGEAVLSVEAQMPDARE